MEFFANEGKSVEIEANGKTYLRHAIKTRFIEAGENYIDIFREYVLPVYEKGDIISSSEKVIAMCQNRIIKKEEIKIGFWARFLSKFVNQTPAGESVGNEYKMQIAINIVGIWKILFAAIASAITKIFGKKGVFYKIVGQEVSGIDGFCADAFEKYLGIAVLIPSEPERVCNDIYNELGISCMIVDANDLGEEILGHSSDITLTNEELKALIKDNPAGQGGQSTPFILIREKSQNFPIDIK